MDTGIHVSFVIIADIDYIIVALGRAGKRLQTDVKGPPVAGPGQNLNLFLAKHFIAGFYAGGRCRGRAERTMEKRQLRSRCRIIAGDHRTTTGGGYDSRVFAQG